LLLAAFTGGGKNSSYVLAGYIPAAGTLVRYGLGLAASIRDVTFSKSGRYVAYIQMGNCGGCCRTEVLTIWDLQEKKTAGLPREAFPPKARMVGITRVEWIGELAIEYSAFGYDDCGEGSLQTEVWKTTGRTKLTDLPFE
jgi:hypothetical protein